MKKVSVETLFKQRYNGRILVRRDLLESSHDPSKRLRAYNTAVKLELDAFREETPAEYEELRALTEEMKASSTQDFDGQPEEVQEA